MGTGNFLGVTSGRGVTLTPHPLQEKVELYLYSPYGPYGLYRASVPVQGCTLSLPYFFLGFWQVTTFRSNLPSPDYPEDEDRKLLRNFETSPRQNHMTSHLSNLHSQMTDIQVFSFLGRGVTRPDLWLIAVTLFSGTPGLNHIELQTDIKDTVRRSLFLYMSNDWHSEWGYTKNIDSTQ